MEDKCTKFISLSVSRSGQISGPGVPLSVAARIGEDAERAERNFRYGGPAQKLLAEYLQQHDSLKVLLSFFDKKNDSTYKDEQTIAYAELQKALFFCKRKKIPLLFVSIKDMINDIRFFNLLEESHIDFRCIDFPWFYKENLPLIKAVVLYEKLEIRINV